jgi:hypothetical protein
MLWRNANYPEAAFKIGAHDNNWQPWNKQMVDVPKDAVSVPGDGFLVYNNTVVMPGAHFLERTNNTASRKLLNFRFFNNIFVIEPAMNKGAPLGTETGLQFERNLFASYAPGTEEQGRIVAGPQGLALDEPAKIGFAGLTKYRFDLKPGSPAIGAGMANPVAPQSARDLGAIPAGALWQAPVVGPQTATGGE